MAIGKPKNAYHKFTQNATKKKKKKHSVKSSKWNLHAKKKDEKPCRLRPRLCILGEPPDVFLELKTPKPEEWQSLMKQTD